MASINHREHDILADRWDCRDKVTSGGLKQFSGVTEQENAMADEKLFNLCLYMWDSNRAQTNIRQQAWTLCGQATIHSASDMFL